MYTFRLFLLVLLCVVQTHAGSYSGMPPGWHAPMAYPSGPLFDDNAVNRVLSGPSYNAALYPQGNDAFAPNAAEGVGLGALAIKLLTPIVKRALWNESIKAANKMVDNYQNGDQRQPKPVPVPPPILPASDAKKADPVAITALELPKKDAEVPKSSVDRAKEMQEYINNLTLSELSVLAQQEEQYHPHINFYRLRYYQMLSGTPIVDLKDTPHPLMCMTQIPNSIFPQLPTLPPSI